MTDKASEDEDKAAEAEFQRVLGNLAKMPPKPHGKAKEQGRHNGGSDEPTEAS